MFTMTVGNYALSVQQGSLPTIYGDYKKHAKLADEFAIRDHGAGELLFVSVSSGQHWPSLVVAQRFALAEAGFDPAVLIVPETHTLFIGAGPCLLAYNLKDSRRLWEDTTKAGFWEWAQHGNTVIMSAELELAAWDVSGAKLWSMPLEPAWAFHVENNQAHVNVLGRKTVFGLREGPSKATLEK
jgi:hypothetical protein